MSHLANGTMGVVLALALVLLGARQSGGTIRLLMAQGCAAGIALMARDAWILAALQVALSGLAMPLGLGRFARGAGLPHHIGGPAWLLAAGGVLAALSLGLGEPGVPLGVVLSGLVLATRTHPLARLAGLAVAQNGIALMTPDMAAESALLGVLPLVPGLAMASLWLRHGRVA